MFKRRIAALFTMLCGLMISFSSFANEWSFKQGSVNNNHGSFYSSSSAFSFGNSFHSFGDSDSSEEVFSFHDSWENGSWIDAEELYRQHTNRRNKLWDRMQKFRQNHFSSSIDDMLKDLGIEEGMWGFLGSNDENGNTSGTSENKRDEEKNDEGREAGKEEGKNNSSRDEQQNAENEQERTEDENAGTKIPSNDERIQEVVNIINRERSSRGLKNVSANDKLMKAASIRAAELEKNFAHQRPDGSDFYTVLGEINYNYQMCGENIAWGQETASEVMQDWMNSDGHRANILGDYKEVGIGLYKDADGNLFWVQIFGTPL